MQDKTKMGRKKGMRAADWWPATFVFIHSNKWTFVTVMICCIYLVSLVMKTPLPLSKSGGNKSSGEHRCKIKDEKSSREQRRKKKYKRRKKLERAKKKEFDKIAKSNSRTPFRDRDPWVCCWPDQSSCQVRMDDEWWTMKNNLIRNQPPLPRLCFPLQFHIYEQNDENNA